MATIKDKEAIERAMKEVKEHPLQCRYVGEICIAYIEQFNRYTAMFDSDITIAFDSVDYVSNTLYFYRKGDDFPIAHITHMGLA